MQSEDAVWHPLSLCASARSLQNVERCSAALRRFGRAHTQRRW